jgi:hypothetical protein
MKQAQEQYKKDVEENKLKKLKLNG